jgi:hypothetical protein
MDLKSYQSLKFELAALLREATERQPPRGEAALAEVRALFARIAADRFSIAVLGRFSRGKTSLLNALLGRAWLPVGLLPLTSVITQVHYGSEPKAVLWYHGSNLFLDAPLAELDRHITERGNPGNAQGVRLCEVELPAEILHRGFTFIDTPGLGSAIAANSRTTQQFLPEADAAILVSGADSPFSVEEVAILDWAVGQHRPLFVVLNKQDLLAPAARAEAAAFARNEVARRGVKGERVFLLSAQQALAARLAGDATGLAVSGMPALEHALVDFLLHEQRRAFLLGLCERITAVPGVVELTERLEAVRARIVSSAMGTGVEVGNEATLPALPPGCEVCSAIADAVWQYFTHAQATLYGDPRAQEDFAARGGFCRPHAQGFAKIAAARETATAMWPLLLHHADAIRRLAAGNPTPERASAALRSLTEEAVRCPACEVAAAAEATAINRLADVVRRQGPLAVHERSALCLPHAAHLLAVTPAACTSVLLRRQAASLERLAEDASRLALQQDAARLGEASKQERQAPVRIARVLQEAPEAQCGTFGRRS